MTASEFAFLALGLVLGVASGSALVVVLGGRPPAREVRLTVERDAVPRRAATLATFSTAPGEPARGGPADRRRMDRDAPVADPPPPWPYGLPAGSGIPVMSAAGGLAPGGPVAPAWPPPSLAMRTTVPFTPPVAAAGPGAVATGRSAAAPGSPLVPERDPALDTLRIEAVRAAERAARAAGPPSVAVLPAPSIAEPAWTGAAAASRAPAPPVDPAGAGTDVDAAPVVIRILRSDHRALVRTVEVLAGADQAMRRPWQRAITGLVEATIRRAIRDGVLDFPVGNAFWDTFTTEQCRSIASALSAAGFRFDGIDGWADDRVPGHRDLTEAVAAAGLEPRRIRAWPTQDEIGALFHDVTVAADEQFLAYAPDLELDAVRELVDTGSADVELLWRHWELARPVLAAPLPTAAES